MWSHLGGAEFASGNIWRDIWNRRQSVTQWFFSLFVSFSDCWPSFSFCCTFVHLISSAFPILYSSFRYLHVSTICFLFFFFQFVISFSWFLSLPHSLTICSFPLLSSYFFFLHCSISLFLTTPTLANPIHRLSETFLGIVNKCLKHCADMSWCWCYSCEKAQAATQ